MSKQATIRTLPLLNAYEPMLSLKQPFGVVYGGGGSGKSYALATVFLIKSLMYPNTTRLVLMKYHNTIREAVHKQFLEVIKHHDLENLFKIGYSPLTINCKNGSEIIFKGVNDPENLKSMTGISEVWMEEASAFTYDDFTQILLRVRAGGADAILYYYISFNPISQAHWLYNTFFSPTPERTDATIIKTTFRDNPYLPKRYLDILASLEKAAPAMWRIYSEGEWGQVEGTVFAPFTESNEYPPKGEETWFGLDFGYTVPTAMIRIDRIENTYHVSEVFYSANLTNESLLHKIAGIFRTSQTPLNAVIYADAAEPARIQAMYQSGLTGVRAATKAVRDGILTIQQLHGSIVIHRSSNLAKELQTYVWQKDLANRAMEEPVKFNDHAIDAMRYALHSHLRNRLPRLAKRLILNP